MADHTSPTPEAPEGYTIAEGEPMAAEVIEAALLDSLRSTLRQSENTGIILTATDGEGKIVGGLTATTSYGWLLIKTLWVSEQHRKCGLGRTLMDRAETKATEIGCHAAWLDTSNPSAKSFYDRLGYETFGTLENAEGQHPRSHQRWFMKKTF